MSEIGSGSGSGFPGALDTNSTVEVDAPNPGKTKARASVINDLSAATIAIETELGTDPAGSQATVRARIDQEHNDDGTHDDVWVVTVSGNNQNVTGRKVFKSGIDIWTDGLFGSSTDVVTGKTTVGVSGAIYAKDDIRASSLHATGQVNGESFWQTGSRAGNVNAEQHNGIKIKIIDIGDWNMDTTTNVTVAHGLTGSKIRSVSAYIISDAGNWTYVLNGISSSGALGGSIAWDSTLIELSRVSSGLFDSTFFDSTSYNRGYITIWYLA